jgi:hypothetical protein
MVTSGSLAAPRGLGIRAGMLASPVRRAPGLLGLPGCYSGVTSEHGPNAQGPGRRRCDRLRLILAYGLAEALLLLLELRVCRLRAGVSSGRTGAHSQGRTGVRGRRSSSD